MSIAVSRSSSSHSVPCGRRYRTLCNREEPVVNWRLAEPFGHSRPRLTGESGSPSIWVTFPPQTYTFWPQPTAQYGQTDLTTWSAVATRGRLSAVILLFTAAPRPVASGPDSCRYTGHSAIHVRTPIQTDPPAAACRSLPIILLIFHPGLPLLVASTHGQVWRRRDRR